MRLHKDGYIEARRFQVLVPGDLYRRSASTGSFLVTSFVKNVCEFAGVEIEGAKRVGTVRAIDDSDIYLITFESDWVRLSRS